MTRTDLHKTLLGWLPTEWQERIGTLRRYSLFGERGTGNAIIACVDGTTFHGGLADRWKGIVSLYAIAKATGRDFRIRYIFPFDLTEFQVSATYDWQLKEGEWSNRVSRVCMKRVLAEPNITRMLRLPQGKQIHGYANRDWVNEVNAYYHTSYTWGELFQELFQPSERIHKALASYQALLPKSYIAVAFRLQNLFGDFTEYDYQPTDTTRQKEITDLCQSYLEQLHHTTQKTILVTSDSRLFAQEMADLPFVVCTTGQAAHTDTGINATSEQYLKSFVDFYLLANAQEVYCAGTKEMYPSEFPLYAAKVHDRPFYRVSLS
jgi:hypothetical protein